MDGCLDGGGYHLPEGSLARGAGSGGLQADLVQGRAAAISVLSEVLPQTTDVERLERELEREVQSEEVPKGEHSSPGRTPILTTQLSRHPGASAALAREVAALRNFTEQGVVSTFAPNSLGTAAPQIGKEGARGKGIADRSLAAANAPIATCSPLSMTM